MEEIKKNSKFKNIDFKNKNDEKIIRFNKKMKEEIEKIKKQLSSEEDSIFYIDMIYGIDEFKLEISRKKYEELCMDLWKKCFKIVDDALKLSKLKKEEIDDIILVGGSTRTPKIKEMVQEYFNGKEPLQNINPDEVVAYGAVLAAYLDLNIHDITSKAIGISIQNGKMDIIIPVGTEIPLKNEKSKKYSKKYTLKSTKDNSIQNISIYQGNNENVSNNYLLGIFSIQVGKVNSEKKVKIVMSIDHNSILEVIGYVDDEKNVTIKFNMINF